MAASLDPITHQRFKHQQEQVDTHCNQHGLELHTCFSFCSKKGQKKKKKKTLSSESPSQASSPGQHQLMLLLSHFCKSDPK